MLNIVCHLQVLCYSKRIPVIKLLILNRLGGTSKRINMANGHVIDATTADPMNVRGTTPGNSM
jgi:hypothetical protein